MNIGMSVTKYFMIVVALMCLPVSANATALFAAAVGEVDNSSTAEGWKYHISNSNPGNADACISNGRFTPGRDSTGHLYMFTVGPLILVGWFPKPSPFPEHA